MKTNWRLWMDDNADQTRNVTQKSLASLHQRGVYQLARQIKRVGGFHMIDDTGYYVCGPWRSFI